MYHEMCVLYNMTAVTLSGMGAQFRGLMVQARTLADGSPVGSFSAFTTNTRASVCTPPEVCIKYNYNEHT